MRHGRRNSAKLRRQTSKSMNHMVHSGINHSLSPDKDKLSVFNSNSGQTGANSSSSSSSASSSSSSSSSDTDDEDDDNDQELIDDEEDSHDDDDDDDDDNDNRFSNLALIHNVGSRFYSADLFDLVCEQKF